MHNRSVRPKKQKPSAAGTTKRVPRARGVEAEAAQVAANEYCLLHYGTSYLGGTPRRLSLPRHELWIVPALFTSPGYGVVGEVGMMAIEVESGRVVGATPPLELRTAGARLARENRDELDAAFRRAGTV
jgi:hypothetical protein